MKRLIAILGIVGLVVTTSCKKKENKEAEETPTPTPSTPTPTVFGDGFKIEDNAGTVLISDSSVCYPNSETQQIVSYRGKLAGDATENVIITIKHPPLRVKTYPLDSLAVNSCFFMFGGFSNQYNPVNGSVTITSLSGSKASGTFNFTVQPVLGGDTRNLIKGTFNNIAVR